MARWLKRGLDAGAIKAADAKVRETVEGEPPEIFPYLGCSRLEEPLSRYPVQAVVHGHAHNGSPEGRTARGVPVYNVAMPLLRKRYPDRPPYRILEIAVVDEDRRTPDNGPPPSAVPSPVATTVAR